MDYLGENSENSLVFIPSLLHFHEKHISSEALKHTLEPNIRNKMSFKRRSLAITCAITSSIVLAGISGTAAAQSSYVSGSSGLLSSSELHPETPAPLDAPKNIIYMIGDGMGYNHVSATNLFETGQTMYQGRRRARICHPS